MSGAGRPRSRRVAVANAMRGIRRGIKTLLDMWEEPAREIINGKSVLARFELQPENRPEMWTMLAGEMRELSRWAAEIADWAETQRRELAVGE